MNNEPDLRFAILIDADNVSEKYIKVILEEVANFGVATYKRIYGDWTSPRLASWKSCLLDHSIIPMQQYSYTFGKNATDSAMIIDAMDILYSGTVDGFAIVSSDSDFTRLVARLRESGMVVIGMGEQKTPRPFISACNQFKYLDLLLAARKAEEDLSEEDEEEATSEGGARKRRRSRRGGRRSRSKVDVGPDPLADDFVASDCTDEGDPTEANDGVGASQRPRRRPGDRGAILSELEDQEGEPDDIDSPEEDESEPEFDFGEMSKADRRRHMRKIRETINAIVDSFSDDDGWVSLGQLGDQLGKRIPDFDVRNYGFKKLRPFLKSLGVYEFDEPKGDSGKRQIYLRIREE
ncbi:MAG: NYN domain-containing protein [Collinsella sp.]|nr:NYN domain-containing protein [Collinsella sp.]